MPLGRFPFFWGSQPSSQTAPTPPAPVPPLWNRITAGGSWRNASGIALIPRFEHIYAQVPNVTVDRGQNLIYRIQSEFAFIIETGNAVTISSSVSNP